MRSKITAAFLQNRFDLSSTAVEACHGFKDPLLFRSKKLSCAVQRGVLRRDAGSLNTFGQNEIEVAPISSALLGIARLVILYIAVFGTRTRSHRRQHAI